MTTDGSNVVVASERSLRAIFEQSPIGIAIIDSTTGRFLTINPKYCAILGYSSDEIVGRTFQDVTYPADLEADLQGMRDMVAGKIQHFQMVKRYVRKDGAIAWVNLTAVPLWDPPEGERRHLAMVEDVTDQKLAADAMHEREERVRTIYESVADVIFHLAVEPGGTYRFVSVNPAFSRVTGIPDTVVLGRELGEIIPPDSIDLVRSRYRRAIDTKSIVRWEETSDYPTGRLIGEVTIAPVFDSEGKCIFVVGTVHDITERVRSAEALARSEERYRRTLESIVEGCQILDFDFRYTYLNDVAAAHNRRPNSELLGKKMPEAWPGIEASPVFGIIKRSLVERVALHDEIEFMFPDGTSGWFDVRVQPVPEGVFVLSIDIAERKAAEKQLRDLNESLERKIHERTLDLEAAKQRAESADRLKSSFLATMSHELRTPLNSILGFTGIVLQGLAGPLSSEQTKQLGMVQSSARHLLDLINDVLDISKIEAGQLDMRLAPFDLRASLRTVVASIAPLAAKKSLAVRLEGPETPGLMESDRRRVEQIVLNLMNNAIKFTDRGSISLKFDVLRHGPAGEGAEATPWLRLDISDTGIGMRHEDLSELFLPFRQIDSGLQRQHEGTGLGLAICRRLVNLLGGTIGVESELGRGSTFTVHLPMKKI